MKKKVKSLIIAASVAAIAGIGAVSFAAWQGTGSQTATGTGATGEINTIGAITVTPSSASGTLTSLNALYPVDQTGEYLKYWEFEVTCDTTGTQAVTFKLAGTLTEGTAEGKTAIGSAALYWSNTTPAAAPADETNKLTGTAQEITLDANNKVYVYLVADNTDAMNAAVSLTFSVEADATA
ncbi:MAG: hypothetical protein K2L54_02180, partial [Clostridiales bacterium]|nr:hypothetical protein [Clostridiales bacterium]